MDKRKQDIAYFVSFCMEQYKNAKELTGADATKVLDHYGVLEYLEEHYDVLQTKAINGFWRTSMMFITSEK